MTYVSVACIAYENGRLFVALRNPSGTMGGRWEFPGGKVEEGETDEQAIIREMREEFGVTVTVREKIAESEFTHSNKVSALHAYRVVLPYDGMEKKFILTEHSGYDWVEPEKIKTLLFVDSDLRIYPQVLAYIDSLTQGN